MFILIRMTSFLRFLSTYSTVYFPMVSIRHLGLEGIIVPIFKGGNVDDTQNYRGITLINILSKIYSQILLNRFSK